MASDEALRRTEAHPHRILFGPAGRVQTTPSGALVVDGEPWGPLPALRVPGQHNVWNLCGAIAGALLLLGRSPSMPAIRAAAEGFEGLPSRCRTVGEHGGLTFVDDALASNPFATVSSLDAFPGRELTVILGGADRGVDTAGLVEALAARRPVSRVVLLPPDTGRLADSLAARSGGPGEAPTVELARDLKDAVRLAVAVTRPVGWSSSTRRPPYPGRRGTSPPVGRRFVQATGVGG